MRSASNRTSSSRKEDLIQKGLRRMVNKISFPSMQERRPHLEGIATESSTTHLSQQYDVGKKTSFRRDCDPPILKIRIGVVVNVGKKTSFRRDCDTFFPLSLPRFFRVGKKTSFRRDCDGFFSFFSTFFGVQERRPHLEGIATLKLVEKQHTTACRKEDLIQKGLRL